MSFNNFKENKCFTVKNWSRFAGITSPGTIESYKGTNSYESKNKYSSVDCHTILLTAYNSLNTLKYLIRYISWHI